MTRKLAVRLLWMWREFVSHRAIEKLKLKWTAFTRGITSMATANSRSR
jgi:hypothetical protein